MLKASVLFTVLLLSGVVCADHSYRTVAVSIVRGGYGLLSTGLQFGDFCNIGDAADKGFFLGSIELIKNSYAWNFFA